jgi:ligand-binding sensor domain-containing protein/signal transduction histidine kinase
MVMWQQTLKKQSTKILGEKSHHIFRVLLLLFLITKLTIFTNYLFSQEISFDCLTLDQGLSQSTVTSIIQDDDGYMWFGTVDGLNRYDGYNFDVYKNNPNDTNSVADNIIMSLCKCKEGIVWIGTMSNGLCRYDSKTGKFKNYALNAVKYDSQERRELIATIPFTFSFLDYYSIKALHNDIFGNLWAGTFSGGLYKFDNESESFIHIAYDKGDSSGLAHNVMSICETVKDEQSTLWLATYGGGLVKYEQEKGFKFYSTAEGLCESRVMSVYPDTLGGRQILWLATFGGGLICFEIEQEEFICYQNIMGEKNSISSNFILSIKRDRFGDLWLGTFDTGLNRFEVWKNKFTCFQHDPTNVNSLGSNEVLSLYEDRTGVIWIGTNFGYGINRFSKGRNLFKHYFHNPSDPRSLSENVVFSLFEDSKGILWVGTFQTGLNGFVREKEEFVNYRYDPGNLYSISDNHIRSIYEDSRNRLWIGTFSGGLNYYDRDKNRFMAFKNDPVNPHSIGGNQIRAVYEDEFGSLWIAVQGAGIDRFDFTNKQFTHFRHDPQDSNTICDNRAYYITGDKAGSLWIATFGGGISLYNLSTQEFMHYSNDPSKINSLCDDRIVTIYPDQTNSNFVWLGSFGSGFDKLNKQTQTFTHYTEENGLPNNVVYAILPDDEGNLWLSTNKGISKFNPETEIFVNYDLTDGLQSNEFNAGAYCRNRITGEMFFGGVNGFNCFVPRDIQVNEIIPNVAITSFKIFDNEVSDSIGPLLAGKEIELTHKDNFFSFEFSVLDYVNTRKNQYAYKLDGVDYDWIYCGNRRYVNYTNLDPGDYIFSVKGANCDGVWNENGTHIKMKIIPRYYQTWWFHPMVVSILILLTIVFLTWRMRQKIKRSVEIERIRVKENEKVRKDISADFHDELGQKLTRISLFSQIVKKEMKTAAPKKVEFIDKIIHVSKELTNSTRDFIWSLDTEKSSLYDTVVYLKDFGDDMFDKTGVNFKVHGINKDFENVRLVVGWRRQLVLLFKEAMHNALKHAKCKNVTFDCLSESNTLKIELNDDGMGIQNENNGSGLGLSNMKNRAAKLGGRLDIVTSKHAGTKIIFIGEMPQMSD